jgi:hypothetical protein
MTTDRPTTATAVPQPRSFRLAPMSPVIRVLTWALLVLPVGLGVGAAVGPRVLFVPLVLVVAAYVWTWLRFRPREFVVHPDRIEVRWPLKRRSVARSTIVSCRTIGSADLRREIGWGFRVGAGGLWGGFGWLWTRQRGIVQMYVSRTDAFVWIERGQERPWLITPERPGEFVDVVAGAPSLFEAKPSSKHAGKVASTRA